MEIRSEASLKEERSTTILDQGGVGGSPPKREYLNWMYDNKPVKIGLI